MSDTIKITGPIFTINSTPSVVPTNAGNGSNANFGSTFSGFGNATVGGATMLLITNNSGGAANVTVANSGANTGTVLLLANQVIKLVKNSYDTVAATPNVVCTPIAKSGE